jgi:hypothetical protein
MSQESSSTHHGALIKSRDSVRLNHGVMVGVKVPVNLREEYV